MPLCPLPGPHASAAPGQRAALPESQSQPWALRLRPSSLRSRCELRSTPSAFGLTLTSQTELAPPQCLPSKDHSPAPGGIPSTGSKLQGLEMGLAGKHLGACDLRASCTPTNDGWASYTWMGPLSLVRTSTDSGRQPGLSETREDTEVHSSILSLSP